MRNVPLKVTPAGGDTYDRSADYEGSWEHGTEPKTAWRRIQKKATRKDKTTGRGQKK